MNISITNACNRRCKYCFQKDWYLTKKVSGSADDYIKEMSLDDFSRLCDWFDRLPVMKLLGGEPLLHSGILDLIKIARLKNKHIAMISNISVAPEIFTEIMATSTKNDNVIKSFLINTDYPKSQEKDFKTNLVELCKTNISLGFSTTLLPDNNETIKSAQRIAELAAIYESMRGSMKGFRVRLAPYCPNPKNDRAYKTFDFTNNVVNLINSLYSSRIEEYGFDCPVNLCEFRTDFIDACRKNGTRVRIERCSPESGMPFDVMVDHSVIWCSSANFLKLDDWRKYFNFEAARLALSEKYYQWWREHGETHNCLSCEKHNPGYCSGLCIAKAYNNKSVEKKIKIFREQA